MQNTTLTFFSGSANKPVGLGVDEHLDPKDRLKFNALWIGEEC